MGDGDDAEKQERREQTRHIACFPAHIQRPGGSARTAVIRDLSTTGVLLLTRATLEVGESLDLSLYLSETGSEPRIVRGRVVRVEARSRDRSEVWPFSVGVQLDEPLLECETEIRDLEARQSALGLPRD
jgi:hypothetical protein